MPCPPRVAGQITQSAAEVSLQGGNAGDKSTARGLYVRMVSLSMEQVSPLDRLETVPRQSTLPLDGNGPGTQHCSIALPNSRIPPGPTGRGDDEIPGWL